MKPVLLIVIALACGLVAAVGVARYMGENRSLAESPLVKILVAKREININEELNGDKLELVEWPQNRVPRGAVSEPQKLADTHARTRLYPGEPILLDKVVGAGESTDALKVPMGYRVVSVKVNMESSVSNLIQPGDRVDLVVVIRSPRESLSKTILRAVRVFAVNSETARSAEHSGVPQEVRAASLLVTPDQAEKLLMAAELGQLRLALRSPDDRSVEETVGCSYERLLGRGDVADNTLAPPAVAASRTTESPRWTMLVCSPRNTSQFSWSSEDAPPECRDARALSTGKQPSAVPAPSGQSDQQVQFDPSEYQEQNETEVAPSAVATP